MRHSDAPKSKQFSWLRLSPEEQKLFRRQLIAAWQWLVKTLEAADRSSKSGTGQENAAEQQQMRRAS